MKIKILATGGTFDKIYYDAKSDFHIGEPMATPILEEANVTFDFEVESILKIDSLELNDADRETIRLKVQQDPCDRIVITHGTDSMIKTAMCLLDIAMCLLDIEDKTIVITGAMQPARMRFSDSAYNIGVATTAVQLLEPGVYVAMHGQILDPRSTMKNVEKSRFETST
jgi:L-asparaginase